MTNPKLSQSKLLEILLKEIEALEKTSLQITEVYPKVEGFLTQMEDRIKNFQVPIDLEPLQKENQRLEKILKNNIMIPQWAWYIMLFAVVIILIVASGYLLREVEIYKHEAVYWKQQYQQLHEKFVSDKP